MGFFCKYVFILMIEMNDFSNQLLFFNMARQMEHARVHRKRVETGGKNCKVIGQSIVY